MLKKCYKPLITNHLQLHSNLVLTHHDSDSESVCNFTIVKRKLSFKYMLKFSVVHTNFGHRFTYSVKIIAFGAMYYKSELVWYI